VRSIGGLEYEVPLQSRLYSLCINVALRSTALQCICRVIRRSSMTMKAHTYYIIFGRPPIGGKLPPSPPWRRHWCDGSCCSPTHGSTQPTDNSAPNFVTAFTWTTMSAATTLCNLVFKSLADNMRQPTEARSTRNRLKLIHTGWTRAQKGPGSNRSRDAVG